MEELSLFTLESLARTGAQELTRLPVLLLEPVGEVLSMQKESVGLLQEGRKNTLKPILRSVFNNLNACIKKPSRQVRVVNVTTNSRRCSAIVAPNRDGNEGRLHQSSTTVVVIGVEQQPVGECQDHYQSTCRENGCELSSSGAM